MGQLIDLGRQLHLLLWKNYVMRKRLKLRIVIEIVWPLFLFLILVLVRTRNLRIFQSHCNFVDRALPSSGLLPFMRSYVCELNNSCAAEPRSFNYTRQLYNLSESSLAVIATLNRAHAVDSVRLLATYTRHVGEQIKQAGAFSSRLPLGQYLLIARDDFASQLVDTRSDPVAQQLLNDTLAAILAANPNFNLLYSNFSAPYVDPLGIMLASASASSAAVPQAAIDLLYGPGLDSMSANQITNAVDSADWLRSKMCASNNTNASSDYLLRGIDDDSAGSATRALTLELCVLADQDLVALFVLVSATIDFGKVKRDVVLNTQLSSAAFGLETAQALRALISINTLAGDPMLVKRVAAVQELYDELSQVGIEKVMCGDTQLSLFTIINNFGPSRSFGSQLVSLAGNQKTNRSLSTLDDYESDESSSSSSFGSQSKLPMGVSRPTPVSSGTSNKPLQNQTNETGTPPVPPPGSSPTLHDYTSVLAYLNGVADITKNSSTQQCPVSIQPSTYFSNSRPQTCFCQLLYRFVRSLSYDIAYVFDQIEPMLVGKILYAPQTPAYRRLVRRLNSTYANVDALSDTLGQAAALLDALVNALNLTSPTTMALLVQLQARLPADSPFARLNLSVVLEQTAFAQQMLMFASNTLKCIELDRFVGFDTEEQAVSLGLNLINSQQFWAVIVFNTPENNSMLPNIVNYKIRMNSTQVQDTNFAQDAAYVYGAAQCLNCNQYLSGGFVYLQDLVERAIVEEKTNSSQTFGISAQMTPYPCYVQDRFIAAIAKSLPLFMVLAWIYTVSMNVKDIVFEKEKRLKEFMRVMGLSNGVHWLAWFITSFVSMYTVAVLLCLLIRYGKVTQFSDLSVLLVFFLCFTIATVTQCFLISVFFNKANLASVVAAIVYFLLYLPYTVLFNYASVIQPWQKLLASLSSTVAFSYGCQLISAYEMQTSGVQWSNFYQTPYANSDGFSLNNICLILLLDSAIHMLLTWYIEGVAPGEYGIPLRWYFPLQPSYWCGESLTSCPGEIKKSQRRLFACACFDWCWKDGKQRLIELEEARQEEAKRKASHVSDMTAATGIGGGDSFESPLDDDGGEKKVVGIEINSLHKVYSRGNNHALKGLTLNFNENEITAFLGHNGAGKSTTMHILTGLYTPTAGTARINGLDIRHSMNKIRKSLGFVPQHNVLFPSFTVKEHLWFYARLKGLDRFSTMQEMERMLDDTGLRAKRNEPAKNLSGGMQRKLSVAIAFVGGSRTVILDEPSAGVDPSGRRSIWDLLFKFKKDRTIVISTHHMDEADVLGDRIAIISNGKLVAHGTSYFLKHKFGRGYYLTLIKKQQQQQQISTDDDTTPLGETDSTKASSSSSDSGARSLSSYADSKEKLPTSPAGFGPLYESMELKSGSSDSGHSAASSNSSSTEDKLTTRQDVAIDALVRQLIPSAMLVANIGNEMTYSISSSAESTKTYQRCFATLEASQEALAIDSMAVSDTTLEEIFIKLAKEPRRNKFAHGGRAAGWLSLFGLGGGSKSAVAEREKRAKAKEARKQLTPEQLALYSTYTKVRVASRPLHVAQQFYALLLKRFHRVKRNIKGFFAEIVLPVVFICLALLVATLTPGVSPRPPIELHPWYYSPSNQFFISRSSSAGFDRPVYSPDTGNIQLNVNESVQSNLAQIDRVVDTFRRAPQMGTRCMKGYKIAVTKQAQAYSSTNFKFFPCYTPDYSLVSNYTMPPLDVVDELASANFSYTKVSPMCDCSNGYPACPASAGGDINYRPTSSLSTGDIVYDLTGRNLTDWLIKTEFQQQFFQRRFGGLEFPAYEETGASATQLVADFASNLTALGYSLAMLAADPLANSTTNPSNSSFLSDRFVGGPNAFIANQSVRIWYNNKAYVASAAYLNVVNNAFLRAKINDMNAATNNESYLDPAAHGIVATNHPMSFTQNQFVNQLSNRLTIDLFVAIFVIFALSFIPASFLVFLLEERSTNAKQLQFVSGVKPYVYWLSNYAWDLINYIVPCVLCFALFLAFRVASYTSAANLPYLISLMLLYGWACIPLMYPLNYLFNLPSTAFVVSSSMNMFIGVVCTMSTTVLDNLGADDKDLYEVNQYLKPLFVILFPHYCLGQGFLIMSTMYNKAQVELSFGIQNAPYTPFGFYDGGKNLIAMAIQGFVFFTFNLLLQYQFFIRFKPTSDLHSLDLPTLPTSGDDPIDDDVAAEKKRIAHNEAVARLNRPHLNLLQKAGHKMAAATRTLTTTTATSASSPSLSTTKVNTKRKYYVNERTRQAAAAECAAKEKKAAAAAAASQDDEDFVKLVNVCKVYKRADALRCRIKRHVAVNDLSLGIKRGECFGLIGVNGAGKTTTFKMITGEIPLSGGDIYVNGHSVSKQIERVHENIGYCPQTDALIPLLTASEHLIFFARLRGIPEEYVRAVSEWAMARVGLTVFADRIAGDFSGGNKRKLSTAIALVGDPTVVCLDEPTSGMDAKARRLLWNDILSLIKEKRIVILTSHSMEECEALCTRLVIMVNGQFKCLGSPQHLKAKFGSGYKLVFRLADDSSEKKQALDEFMRVKFATCDVTSGEAHKNLYEYLLPQRGTLLSRLFGHIERHRERLHIMDYSVSQTSLDQIFVNFAKGNAAAAADDPFLVDGDALQRNASIRSVANIARFDHPHVAAAAAPVDAGDEEATADGDDDDAVDIGQVQIGEHHQRTQQHQRHLAAVL